MTEQVIAYQRKAIRDGSTLDVVPLVLPEVTFETEAVWFCPDGALLEGLEEMPKLLGALHAAEHALISLLPLWAMCDRWDIGGLSTNLHFQTGLPTVFVYDGHAGGVGITERGFESFAGWVADTARLLAGCPCTSGCPSCVQSPKCGNLNEMLDKAAAALLLDRMSSTLSRCRFRAAPFVVMVKSSQRRRRRQRGVLALVYGDPDAWEQTLGGRAGRGVRGLHGGLARRCEAAGALVDASELESTAAATSVRVRDGEALVTDGPYAEVKESLGGYYLFSCDSLEEAIDWAAKIPAAWHGGAIEVRPVHVDEEAAA